MRSEFFNFRHDTIGYIWYTWKNAMQAMIVGVSSITVGTGGVTWSVIVQARWSVNRNKILVVLLQEFHYTHSRALLDSLHMRGDGYTYILRINSQSWIGKDPVCFELKSWWNSYRPAPDMVVRVGCCTGRTGRTNIVP